MEKISSKPSASPVSLVSVFTGGSCPGTGLSGTDGGVPYFRLITEAENSLPSADPLKTALVLWSI